MNTNSLTKESVVMAIVKPFKAVRPDEGLVDKVAALPYDVMTSDEAREMVKNNPYSFLHVDKAEIDLDKDINLYDPKVYAKARENLNKMIADGVYIEEGKAMFYIYRLTMNGRSQTGLVACTSIDEYLENKIKKHELTRADKEQDRINHVEICDANTGPIFLTYSAVSDIDSIIDGWMASHSPVYDFISDDGIGNTVWLIDDDSVNAAISDNFLKVPALYIADGHHRSASAVKVGLKKREANPGYTGDEEFNYFLSVIFPHDQLYIMDYNRVLKNLNGNTEEEFFNKIKEKFEIEEYANGDYRPENLHNFGMYMDGKWYKLTAKEGIYDNNDPVDSLDVSILQNNLLEPVLGIQDPRISHDIDFVGGIRGLSELRKRVDSGEMKLAFAMHPTSMIELMNIADAGKIMPPKSTWFEPKLKSGIFIHKLS